jgi:ABC-type nitrate/sulfonate/bicarbonate transport system permease component
MRGIGMTLDYTHAQRREYLAMTDRLGRRWIEVGIIGGFEFAGSDNTGKKWTKGIMVCPSSGGFNPGWSYAMSEEFSVYEQALNGHRGKPMAAIIPLLMMSVGFGLASRVILVTILSIVMVVVNCRAGVRQVDPSLIEMARSFGATERQVWSRILLPGALPAIMTGIRLGVGRAVTGMVIVELLLVSAALGGLILEYRGLFKAPLLYGTIVIILAEALLLISAARWATRWVRPAR